MWIQFYAVYNNSSKGIQCCMKAKQHVYDLNRVNLWEYAPLDTPYLIVIEPTFRCNIRCNYCIHSLSTSSLKKQGLSFDDMKWETFERTVEQISKFPHKIKQITFSGNGEPLLHRQLPEMIRLLKKSNVAENILVISNGLLLTPEIGKSLVEAGLTTLRISLQGVTGDKYKDVCGVDVAFDDFFDNLEHFYKNKGNTVFKIKIADTGLEPGEENAFYKKFGVICDYIDIEHISDQFPGVDYSNKIRNEGNRTKYGFEYKRLYICSQVFFKLNVMCDGKIIFGYPDGLSFEGFNVNELSLVQAWNSPEYITFLSDMLSLDFKKYSECENCLRYSRGAVIPEDIIDGHEDAVLLRLEKKYSIKKDTKRGYLYCANGFS